MISFFARLKDSTVQAATCPSQTASIVKQWGLRSQPAFTCRTNEGGKVNCQEPGTPAHSF